MGGKSRQLDRFKEAARQLETVNDEAKFNATLNKVAKAKVPVEPPKE